MMRTKCSFFSVLSVYDRSELPVVMHDRISVRASTLIFSPAVAKATFDFTEGSCKSAFGVISGGKRV
jgi:hypothetical protein